MTILDVGAPTVAEGTCTHCTLDRRPLWTTADLTACATCIVRRYPGRDITFHVGPGPITARQDVLPDLVA